MFEWEAVCTRNLKDGFSLEYSSTAFIPFSIIVVQVCRFLDVQNKIMLLTLFLFFVSDPL